MKRVLIISYYWPPSGGSGVQRWVKLSKYLPSEGWQPVVYTPSNPALTSTDATLASEVSSEVEVIRHPIFEPGQFASKKSSSQASQISSGRKSFKQRLALWVRANLFIPDPRVFWVRPSVNFLLEYLKGHPVDAVISTGPPHSVHLIAKRVSEKTGLPWLADFRDPWTRMFYFKHLPFTAFSRRLHERLEQGVLDAATRVIAVSPFVKRDFEAATATKVELVTNGYDAADFTEAPVSRDGFTMVHAGLLTSDGNPKVVWNALGRLSKADQGFAADLRLVLCGKTDNAVLEAIRDAGIEGNVTNLGYLSHPESVRTIQGATVLLLPIREEPESRNILPGKLFEYLATRRPILGIDDPTGASAEVIASKQAGAVYGWNDEDAVEAWIRNAYSQYKAGTLAATTADIEEYSRHRLAGKVARILKEVADE